MNITGSRVIKLDSIPSTNDFAEQLLSISKQPEGTIVLAEYQTAGKGQGQNQWLSEKGKNILMSVILYPVFLTAEKQFFLNAAMTLAVFNAIRKFIPSGIKTNIKWPNDIYAGNKKIAGILIKNSLAGDKIKYTVAGTGININQKSFSPCLNATSLALISGKENDKESVLQELLKQLDVFYRHLKENNMSLLQENYNAHLLWLGEYREFGLADGSRIEGAITGVSTEGKLLIKTGQTVNSYRHGEVVLLSKNNE